MRRKFETLGVVALCLAPAAWLVVRFVRSDLGADPVETIQHQTGLWALRFLLVTLAITPLQRLFRLSRWVRQRRTLGLVSFGYAVAHFVAFVWLDQWFVWDDIAAEIAERTWITIGFAALLTLVPLAATSTRGMVQRLGARRWRRLHRLVYASAAGGVFHYWFAVKADTRLPLVYAAVLAGLLGFRIAWRFRKTPVGLPRRGERR